MSNLMSGIAPAASLVAQSTPANVVQSARGTDGNIAQSISAQRVVVSGAASNPAVLVTISSDARARVPSYGAGRSVDATFEKQEAEEKLASNEKESDGKGSKAKSLRVTA